MALEYGIEPILGGVGGVYFLAEPGELTVSVMKRDRHVYNRHTELRAILVGPDRGVIEEARISDDGQAAGSGLGDIGRVEISTQVARKGIYALNITVSQDRYGEEIAWGFRTNCRSYLIETSRGHKDARHEEPIVLLNPDGPGDICFLPRFGAFDLEVSDLPDGVKALTVFDGNGEEIHSLPVETGGKASYTYAEGVHRDTSPWRLHLPQAQATVQIDGVTRWEKEDVFPDLSLWTPEPKSFFPFHPYRWLLTPYRKTVYGDPGTEGELHFQVQNNGEQQVTVELGIEYPAVAWPAQLSAERVRVGAKETVDITVEYTIPDDGETRVCHVRATPVDGSGVSTYATLTVQAGEAPVVRPLDIPILLRAYEHENEQFGYVPDYPVENQVYFDLENRPFVRTATGVATLRDGRWEGTDLRDAVRGYAGKSFGMPSTKLAFDGENDLYLVATLGRESVLLYSRDGGKTFDACPIAGREDASRTFDIEIFSGHNTLTEPPPVLRYTQTRGRDPGLFWRRENDLELFLPRKVNGHIELGDPILISQMCIGISQHSGTPGSVVSRGSKVHVAWGEATDPEADVPGLPAYVATYDRETGKLTEPALVGYGAPANDVHNAPCITMDGDGYLHVLGGTHGQPFPYARSVESNDAGGGVTETEYVGEGLRQTYIGMVCGQDGTLHTAFRMWRSEIDPHPKSGFANLTHQHKPSGEPWEDPRVLVVAPFSEYSIFYHRLTIDRKSRLFLSYDYWSTFWFYRTDHPGKRRALLMSEDGGMGWKLVETKDF
ncbi:MAG: BNR-4 repeat-containing protein [bacterium]|nr:BNR-4 repeat-containing protein [bacterium]